MKLSKRVQVYVAGATLVFSLGVVSVLVLKPDSKEVTLKQASTVTQPSQETATDETVAAEEQTATQKPASTVSAQTVTSTQQTQANTPVTVTAYEAMPVSGSKNVDCKLTYSDGTTYTWRWQEVTTQQGWTENGNGSNGHYAPYDVTTTTDSCDQSVIGSAKR